MLSMLLFVIGTDYERKKLTEIYIEHREALYYAAFKICNNQQMAEDAVHNTFEQLIKNKEEMFTLNFQDFRRRYTVVVKNKTIDLMRKEKIYEEKGFEDFEYKLEMKNLPFDIQMINKEEYTLLKESLETLDEVSRVILVMKYVFNKSYKDIASAMNVSTKYVDTKMVRAKAKIKNRILKQRGQRSE